MIRITMSEKHPITVVTDDDQRYHFAWVVSASPERVELQLRRPNPRLHLLRVTHLIVETFGQLSGARFGTVSIEIDCRNVSVSDEDLLLVRPISADAVQLVVTPFVAQ